ncbi:restriction endonuclease subunit S [Helicobacter suis]|uniref:restriction endonuclease subunit S n=1 Tax=Helicobacter suis TaxID=104628 RepID=UPI0013D879AC|nr:restriction endonuclease subunit S [Helicobacter suis]
MSHPLAQKYPHLEVSVLKLSEVFKDNPTKRIDAEYFKREYVENEERIKKLPFTTLNDLCYFIRNGDDCREYVENGRHYIRTGDIKDFGLDLDLTEKVSFDFVPKTVLGIGDVLVTRKGNYGKSQVIWTTDILESVISSEIFQLKVNGINPFYLDIFLKTEYGQLQFEKHIHGVSNFSITQDALLTFLIPLLPLSFQQHIETLVKRAHASLQQSKALYKSAQDLLSSQLGLDSKGLIDHLSSSNYTIKTLKESFLKTGRLDAEYYQEKYERMEQHLKSYGFVILEEICSLINYGSVPTSPYSENDDAIPYIKGLNLKHLQISGKLDRLTNTERLPSKFFVQENDIIISQMGTVGDVGIISKEQEGYIFASFTIRIRLKEYQNFNPFFIALYIQHIAKRWYLHRNIAQASVRQNTDLPTIRNLYIPKIPQSIQEHIARYLQKSFVLRQQAYKELERAKLEVECALAGGGGGIPFLNAA